MLLLFTLMSSIQEFSSLTTYGLVIEVAVTGEKKTIIARSSVQVSNMHTVDMWGLEYRVHVYSGTCIIHLIMLS